MDIHRELIKRQNKIQAKNLSRFFKTGVGEYGAGDKFLGIKVPVLRALAKQFVESSFPEVQILLKSVYHEERLLGAFILVYKFQRADEKTRAQIYKFYLKNWRALNNWDIIDTTTPKIVGEYLVDKDKKIIYEFARSNNLWKKRIAVLTTFSFIKQHQFEDFLLIAEILIRDKHDLIHKAVGWMLREVGKRDLPVEETFLRKWYKMMPRTMLRYSIEKFPEAKRQQYLNGGIGEISAKKQESKKTNRSLCFLLRCFLVFLIIV
ncbi:MAG: hypothetical protein UT32_C0004G0010 [Parcubacteria group bacterium GW2011_GWC2_39_14]|nr:MAG: hypothetical protein UT32_C0004G0010 [Parcubacteria group bacterium GW2011_GWC2_39_14]KKR54854.1 MAG: hypothetical protein UT91_C0008G0010 [Parcubacteria group bacterium GW2011_GWA2_40_23]